MVRFAAEKIRPINADAMKDLIFENAPRVLIAIVMSEQGQINLITNTHDAEAICETFAAIEARLRYSALPVNSH